MGQPPMMSDNRRTVGESSEMTHAEKIDSLKETIQQVQEAGKLEETLPIVLETHAAADDWDPHDWQEAADTLRALADAAMIRAIAQARANRNGREDATQRIDDIHGHHADVGSQTDYLGLGDDR